MYPNIPNLTKFWTPPLFVFIISTLRWKWDPSSDCCFSYSLDNVCDQQEWPVDNQKSIHLRKIELVALFPSAVQNQTLISMVNGISPSPPPHSSVPTPQWCPRPCPLIPIVEFPTTFLSLQPTVCVTSHRTWVLLKGPNFKNLISWDQPIFFKSLISRN